MRWPGLVLLSATLAGCTVAPARGGLVLLSRAGCANTPLLQSNLEAALVQLGRPRDAYEFIDADRLPAGDLRVGYPTPTILSDGEDIFGLPAPSPPLPEPT